jgi:2-dehydropantoate 2-reductase
MRVVVVGGGAIGISHAAFLSRVVPTTLLVRRPEQVEEIYQSGLQVTNLDGTVTVDYPTATVDDDCLDEADVVIVTVKGYDMDDIAKLLKDRRHSISTVIPMQNGFGHEQALVDACGQDRVTWAMTGFSGRRTSDSSVEISSIVPTMIGEDNGELTDRITQIEAIMSSAGIPTQASTEIKSVLWSKFAQACCQNALSALTRKTFGELRETPHAVELLRRISEEMKLLAEAEGIPLLFDPYERQMEKWKNNRHRSSMLQDLDSCRPTEIDALNGVAVELGAKHGIDVPVNQAMWFLTKATEC